MARGPEREEDAGQHHQHRGRHVHHLRPDGPSAFLLQRVEDKGHSGQKGHHGPGPSGHRGCRHTVPRPARGVFPAQLGTEVGNPDALVRRGGAPRILHARTRLLLHPRRAHGPHPDGRNLHPRVVGGERHFAIHQAIQILGQLGFRLHQRPFGRQGRPRLREAEHLQAAMDPRSGYQGKPGIDLLGLGEPVVERLQQIFGDQPQRHALDADQLVDIVLEELGGHALLALDEHGRVTELADGGDIGHAAQHIVQRIEVLPLQTLGETGQGSLVRKDLDELLGQDHQLGERLGEEHLLARDARQHAQRRAAQHPRAGVVQRVQLPQHHPVGQLHRTLVLQEDRSAVEPRDQQGGDARSRVRILPPIQLHHRAVVLDQHLRNVAGEGQVQEIQVAGDKAYHIAVDKFLVRARFQQTEVRLLPNSAERFDGSRHHIFALREQRLRRARVRAQHGDVVLALAEPRNKGAEQARHFGREEDIAHRRLQHKRIVQLPRRLDEAVDHIALAAHQTHGQAGSEPARHARSLRGVARGQTLRPPHVATRKLGTNRKHGMELRLLVQVARLVGPRDKRHTPCRPSTPIRSTTRTARWTPC